VSLDEEAANMVRYQNAYEASAKVIKASDEMFKAVLGLLP
jgi:flagellar hook-associated protein 1 FlgK